MDAAKSKVAFLMNSIKPLIRKKKKIVRKYNRIFSELTHKHNHKDKKKQMVHNRLL